MFSVVILTFNEEENLPQCLASIPWCDDVWVVDSFSTDRTVEIAKAHGAKVVQRVFDNFGDQRNYAIDMCAFKHSWVFDLDADERFTDALRAECERLIGRDQESGYLVAGKMMLWGKWIRHASCFPVYQMRLHKIGEVRFVAHGHGQRESDARRGLGYLKEAYVHYNFSKGLEKWYVRHANYARNEADEFFKKEGQRVPLKMLGDPLFRRRALKNLSEKLPFRPLMKFVYLFVVRKGFLDGGAGLAYCLMQSYYEFMIITVIKDQAFLRKTSSLNR